MQNHVGTACSDQRVNRQSEERSTQRATLADSKSNVDAPHLLAVGRKCGAKGPVQHCSGTPHGATHT